MNKQLTFKELLESIKSIKSDFGIPILIGCDSDENKIPNAGAWAFDFKGDMIDINFNYLLGFLGIGDYQAVIKVKLGESITIERTYCYPEEK